MRGKKAFLDSFLAVMGIVGTLFLVYCSSAGETPVFGGGEGEPAGPPPPPLVAGPPVVVATFPASGDTNTPTNIQALVLFSEAMSPASVEAAFAMSPAGGTTTFTWEDPRILAVDFSPDLSTDTTYTVTVGAGSEDLQDETLAAPYQFSFNTGDTTTTSYPVIVGTYPVDNARFVPTTIDALVVFSEAMSQDSVESAFAFDSAVVAPLSWIGPRLLKVGFSPALAYDSYFTLTIGAGASAVNGGTLPEDFSLDFSTVPEVSPPRVVEAGPDNTYVFVQTDLNFCNVQFSEAMSASSVVSAFSIEPDITVDLTIGFSRLDVDFPSDLASDTEYTITIDNTALDLQGEALASDFTFSFRTAPPSSFPYVVRTWPADSATDVPAHFYDPEEEDVQFPYVIFSEAIDPGSIQDRVVVYPDPGFSAEPYGSYIRIIPSHSLAYNTTYTVTLKAGIEDLS
ncbi:MAG: Ig-like domain-containing protein, partial [bacterium]